MKIDFFPHKYLFFVISHIFNIINTKVEFYVAWNSNSNKTIQYFLRIIFWNSNISRQSQKNYHYWWNILEKSKIELDCYRSVARNDSTKFHYRLIRNLFPAILAFILRFDWISSIKKPDPFVKFKKISRKLNR